MRPVLCEPPLVKQTANVLNILGCFAIQSDKIVSWESLRFEPQNPSMTLEREGALYSLFEASIAA